MDFDGKKPCLTRDSKSDFEHLLGSLPSLRVGSAATPLPLLDFLGAIRKFMGRFTRIQWLNHHGFESKREQGILDLEVRSKEQE